MAGAGRAENHKSPALFVLLHQFKEPQGPLPMEKKILIHGKEGPDLEFFFQLTHDGKEVVAGFIKINMLPLTPEKGGGGTEVTTQGTAHGRDEHGRRQPETRLRSRDPVGRRGQGENR